MQRRKKDKRMGAVEWLERKFDITPDVLDGVRIELYGQNKLLLQGCRKIRGGGNAVGSRQNAPARVR